MASPSQSAGSNRNRLSIDFATGTATALLDHPEAPSDVWAFGIVRREIALGDHAWAYLDGFDRLRVLRAHLCSTGTWMPRLRAECDLTEPEQATAEALLRTVDVVHTEHRAQVSRPTASIEGRVALVTGASRGIGSALAQRLASAGAVVVASARTLDRAAHQSTRHVDTTLAEIVALIRERGGRGETVLGDLTDPATPERMVAEVTARFGPIDIVVNNAARAVYHPVEGWTGAAMGKLMQANALAPAELAQRTIPGMRARGFGAIVNVSSIVAEHPIGPPYGLFERSSYTTVYAMAKAAIDRMSSGWAIETWQHGVRINAISPSGGVRTPGALAMTPMLDAHPENSEAPETMAEAVLALCEPLEPMITGRILTSGALLADLERPVRGLDGGPFDDPYAHIDLRQTVDLDLTAAPPREAMLRRGVAPSTNHR